MATIEEIEEEIDSIKERNRSVEADKAWETSWSRRIVITVLTYIFLGAYLWSIQVPRPWMNAVVPAVAFILATAVLPPLKKLWLAHVHER